MSHAEYIHCILKPSIVDHPSDSWCGRYIRGEWHYTSLDHAAMSAPRDRMVPCRKCLKVAIRALRGEEGK